MALILEIFPYGKQEPILEPSWIVNSIASDSVHSQLLFPWWAIAIINSTIQKVHIGFSFCTKQFHSCLLHWHCGNHTYDLPSANGRILKSIGNVSFDVVRSKTNTKHHSTRPRAYFNTNNVQPIFPSEPIAHSRHLSFLVLVSLLITEACPANLVEYLSTPRTDTFIKSYNQCECIVSLYINTHCHQISDRDT